MVRAQRLVSSTNICIATRSRRLSRMHGNEGGAMTRAASEDRWCPEWWKFGTFLEVRSVTFYDKEKWLGLSFHAQFHIKVTERTNGSRRESGECQVNPTSYGLNPMALFSAFQSV